MRVLFTFLSAWETHIGIELELLQRHLDAGDEVRVATCLGEVPSCVYNPEHKRARCASCLARRLEPLARLSRPIVVEPLFDYVEEAQRAEIEGQEVDFTTLEAARELRDSPKLDVGFAALSSTVHRYRESALETPASRAMWRKLLTTFRLTHAATKALLAAERFDRVYLFNGRFAITRGVLRACEAAGVEVHLFERGSTLANFSRFVNHLPHDRGPFLEALEQTWAQADPATREAQGAQWFERRRAGKVANWVSFTDDQTRGRLPDSWDPARRNIVIFNSSEDEFVGIGSEWLNPIYPTQAEAIAHIARDLADDDVALSLRIHPNLRDVDNADTRALAVLPPEQIEVIPAESDISSYDLMAAADVVLTFGSSMGAEATYWGIPSVLAGLSFYRDLDVAHVAGSHEEVLALLRAVDLPAKPKLDAIRYGLHLATAGEPLRHYQADDLFTGRFDGRPLRMAPVSGRYAYRLLTRLLGRHHPRALATTVRAVSPTWPASGD